MTVRLIEDGAVWDRFLDETPYGSIFHRWRMLKIVEKYSDYKLLPYGVYRGAELICVFPLFFRAYRGMKLVFSRPPQSLLPYLGFVMGPTYPGLKQKRKEAYLSEVAAGITAEIRRLSPNFVTLQTEPCFEDIRPFLWQDYRADLSYDYYIDLGKPLEEIWAGFDSTCKKQIKHAGSLGLRMGLSDDVNEFYRIMGDNFKAKGRRSLYRVGDPAYLKEFLDAYPEHIKMYFLYEGEKVAGAHVVCEYRGKFTLWLGSASGHYNEYMLWELIKMEKAAGLKIFEIPGADARPVLPFKSKFNPGLELKFNVCRKDALGTVAEWTFANIVKAWI
ncbi:MAG: hypothetical protein A4E28_02148 [Methanocella sp. PtaU1.Bin125]|nr:MAG: hypothetical protein A4E28_02148 [Methanocella sp. PtaU1.Bin125]